MWLYMVLVLSLIVTTLSGCTQQQAQALEIHFSTAASHVLVATFSDGFDPARFEKDPLLATVDDYLVNAKKPSVLYFSRSVIDQKAKTRAGDYPLNTMYRVYLVLEEALVNDTQYSIETPYGVYEMVFHDKHTSCESIKVNQVGYHPQSTQRYANLGVFMGDGGSLLLQEPVIYRVIDEHQREIFSSQAEYRGYDGFSTISSGEHVYRLDLAKVPKGGPYWISVDGFGISHPFSISLDAVRESAFVYTRGLYHQRCGIALEQPYTEYTRDICHQEVAITRTPWSGTGFIHVDPIVPKINIFGGYHDAGDFDRRPFHTIIPLMMLSYYEAFPSHFFDGQFNLPESGNTLPDFLDEALWGVSLYQNLQIDDPRDRQYGGICAGTETSAHPEYGKVNAATDHLVYGTWAVSLEVTAYGAGLMAHSARLLKAFPQFQTRAEGLYNQALLAWQYHQEQTRYENLYDVSYLYASLQLYLASLVFEEDNAAFSEALHQSFEKVATLLLIEDGSWPHQYRPGNSMAQITTSHFISYLLHEETKQTSLAKALHALIEKEVAKGTWMGFSLQASFYPQGATKAYGWGAATAQGRYADPYIYAYRLATDENRKQELFDIVSQFSDYALGLNPLGMSFVTGLGTVQVASPLHLDSYFFKEAGMDPVPGILVFGPTLERSNAAYQRVVSDVLYPEWEDLPAQRRWTDGWSLVNSNEFTVWETMIWNICMFGFLSGPAQ